VLILEHPSFHEEKTKNLFFVLAKRVLKWKINLGQAENFYSRSDWRVTPYCGFELKE